MDKADVQAAFEAAGLTRVVKDIDALARFAVRLNTTAVDEANVPVGASKLGGLPDLPPGLAWPEWKGVPQSFIAQIRLEDLHDFNVAKALPQQGMLWFFYDAQQQTYGEDPQDKGGWSVLYNADITKLQRATVPAELPASGQFHACSIRYTSEITLAQQPELDIPNFDWSTEEQHQYEQLLSTFPDSGDHTAMHNRLLGNPDTLQDDMRSQCQLMSHGVTDPQDPRAAAMLKDAKKWHLLLQVDSDEHAGMRWASSGMLYYWIQWTDLMACHFENTWLALQSE